MVPGYVGGVLVDEPQFKGVAVLKHPTICLSTAHFLAMKNIISQIFNKYDK